MSHPVWQYDEFKQVGKDYSNQTEVENYESSHADFRDIEAESHRVLAALAVKSSDMVIDFGSGTGAFAIQAARHCSRVYAIDVSQAMLDYAQAKASQSGVSNIVFCHAGFLTYDHADEKADAICSTFAFHHLPDLWKGVALHRLHGMLKPHGKLYIRDVIVEEKGALANIGALIEKQTAAGGDFLREDAEEHFREEYSTYDWVMDGLLIRAGFAIKSKNIQDGILGTYLCTKKS